MKRTIVLFALALAAGCTNINADAPDFKAKLGSCTVNVPAGSYTYQLAGDKLTVTLPTIGATTFSKFQEGEDYKTDPLNAVWRGTTTNKGNVRETMMLYVGADAALGLDMAVAVMNECLYYDGERLVRGITVRGVAEAMIDTTASTMDLLNDAFPDDGTGTPADVTF
jgi:hypothetical protein